MHFCTEWGQGAKENLWAQGTAGYVMYVQRNTVARSRNQFRGGNVNSAFRFLSATFTSGVIFLKAGY